MADTEPFGKLTQTLIQHAVLAPSSHNTQPWRFRASDSAIDLLADRTRALPVNDPHDRELTISCGAALMNLRIAAARYELAVDVRLLPDREQPDWLARVAWAGRTEVGLPEAELFECIARRRTYRKRFAPQAVDTDELDVLIDAASAEGARLRPLLTEASRQRAAALVDEGDAAQWANPSWRRELAVWLRPRRPGDGLTVPGLTVPAVQWIVRTFDMGRIVGTRDREFAEASPLLAVLETAGDAPRHWLLAGQALERVLLVACRLGLGAAYLNQPIQVSSLRPRLQTLAGNGGFPQILLRLGYPLGDVPPASRRPVEDVLDRER